MYMQAQLSKMLFLEVKEVETVGGKWLLLVFNLFIHVYSSCAFVLNQEATKG